MANEFNERGEAEGGERRRGFPSEKTRALLGKDEEEFDALLSENVSKSPSFIDAILGLWSKLDGFDLEGQRFPPQPFSIWPPEQLKQEYAFWSVFKPEDQQGQKVEAMAEVKETILESIRKTSVERGFFAKVVLGMEVDARSAGEVSDFKDSDVRRDNEEVGDFFAAAIRRFAASIEHPLTRSEALQIQEECKRLQEKYNFRRNFRPEEVDSYSKAELALQKISEYVEKELPVSQTAERPVVAPNPIDIQAQVSESVLARAREMNAERQRIEAELRRGGRRDETFTPPTRDIERIARDLLTQGEDPTGVPELANALARAPHWSSFAVGTEEFTPVDLAAERVRGSRDINYSVKKRELLANDDWSGYGWSREDKRAVVDFLLSSNSGIDSEVKARNLMAAVLLHGDNSRSFMEGVQRAGIIDYLDNLGIVVNDEDALKVVMPSDQKRKSYRNSYFQTQPRNIEELAWQIAFETPHMFGDDGPYPVLEKTVRLDPITKRFKLTEWVNPDNMMQWMRYAEMQAHANHTQRAMDFAQEVGVQKEFKRINVYEMLEYKAMGKSKYGKDYKELVGAFERETSNFGLPRASYLDIWHAKTSADDMVKVRKAQGWENNSTRPFYAQSALAWHLKTPEKYDIDIHAPSDGKMGAVSNTIFMAYLHILNPDEMAKVLGVGNKAEDLAQIFNLDNLRKIRNQSAEGAEITSMMENGEKLDPDKWLNLLKPDQKINGVKLGDVFDFTTGLPKLSTHEQKYKFAKLINFYSYTLPDEHFKTLIRKTIATHAAKMHGLRTTINGVSVGDNLTEAEMIAFYNTWYLGVSSINGVLDESHQWESKTTGMHRWNQVGGRPVGGAGKAKAGVAGQYGNIYTIGMFKRLLASPIYAYKTTETGGSKTVFQVFDEAQKMRAEMDAKVRFQVDSFMTTERANALVGQKIRDIRDRKILAGEMSPSDKITDALIDTAREEVRIDEWDRVLKTKKEDLVRYSKKAEELIFPEDTQLNHFKNQYERAYRLDKRTRQAEGIKFDKYIKYVPYVGATFDQEAWQKDMSEVITDARYAFSVYPLDYTSEVWDWDPKEERMKKMPLGASMFAQQLVDIPEFKDKNGNFSWEIVNSPEGRINLYKRWVEVYITGQLLQYRQLAAWNTNPRYSFTMTEDILEAIEKIPGGIEIDPTNMRATKVTGGFFSKEAMARIRKQSGTAKFGMYYREMLIKGFFGTAGQKDGFFSGLAELLSAIGKESFVFAA